MIEEDTIVDWNGGEYNPVVKVDETSWKPTKQATLVSHQSGEPAFQMKMGELSYIELPIDDASWDQAFQDGGDLTVEAIPKTHQDSHSLSHQQPLQWLSS